VKDLVEIKADMEDEPRNHPYFAAPSGSVLSAYDAVRYR
jgi:hypothetical protein